MKRHPALRQLSSDHHQSLVWARRLQQAAGGDADKEETARGFLDLWEREISRHFREEEEILLPSFARYGDPSSAPVVEMLVQHVLVRRFAGELSAQHTVGRHSAETMKSLGELLRAHIRLEEDVVFPLIESAMPDEALARLPAQFEAAVWLSGPSHEAS